jgi:hypothetical protein
MHLSQSEANQKSARKMTLGEAAKLLMMQIFDK